MKRNGRTRAGRGRRAACAGALALAWLAAAPLPAQTLDPASQEALSATLRMLTDPALRGQALAGSPSGAAADRQIQDLAGSPELTQEIYALAAQVFEDLARGSGGDAQAMVQALERGKGDPAAFAALLSPATLDRLRALSTRIADEQTRKRQ